MAPSINASDVGHLAVLERGPFAPVGWLYQGVYADLASRGLVRGTFAGFELTTTGREQLELFRKHVTLHEGVVVDST